MRYRDGMRRASGAAATLVGLWMFSSVCLAEPDRSMDAKVEGKRTSQAMMQNKLRHMNELFGAIIVGDVDQARKSSQLLAVISKATEWQNDTSKDFVHYAHTFQRSVDNVLEKLDEKDPDAIMLAYLRLSMACSYCHSEIRDKPGAPATKPNAKPKTQP